MLAVSSDKGTIHVFNMESRGREEAKSEEDSDARAENAKSRFFKKKKKVCVLSIIIYSFLSLVKFSLSFMKSFLPRYFSSQWSFAQFRVPENTINICAFGTERNTLIGWFFFCIIYFTFT